MYNNFITLSLYEDGISFRGGNFVENKIFILVLANFSSLAMSSFVARQKHKQKYIYNENCVNVLFLNFSHIKQQKNNKSNTHTHIREEL
jgi:hypothetical protein